MIKTYSPNLMVHPLMRQSPSEAALSSSSSGTKLHASDTDPKEISKKIIEMLPRLHVLVVGPGLGRDPLMHDTLAEVLAAARERKMPVVMDADALGLILKTPELVMGWREVVLTPNVVEFGRLWKGVKGEEYSPDKVEGDPARHIKALSEALGGVTIVQKGGKDLISNGQETLTVDLKGGLKRSGGQGDTLTGSIATFLGWRAAYLEGLWETKGDLKEDELLRLAAFGGAAITRVSSLCLQTRVLMLQAREWHDAVCGRHRVGILFAAYTGPDRAF